MLGWEYYDSASPRSIARWAVLCVGLTNNEAMSTDELWRKLLGGLAVFLLLESRFFSPTALHVFQHQVNTINVSIAAVPSWLLVSVGLMLPSAGVGVPGRAGGVWSLFRVIGSSRSDDRASSQFSSVQFKALYSSQMGQLHYIKTGS